jgi:hypothetical protein
MKIVKLTSQFNAKKKHGFEIGIKFNGYWDNGYAVEDACKNILGKYPYFKEKHQRTWYGEHGRKRDPKTEIYPYWIYLKKESYLTAVLLSLKGD